MTVFLCDGFESYGDTGSAGADVQALFNATNRQLFQEVSGGHGGDMSLIDDFESVGYAIQFPDLDAGRSEWLHYEFPDGTGRHSDYKVPTNASAPIMCCGFRFFNAAVSPAQTFIMWYNTVTSTSTASAMRRLSDGTSLRFTDASANTFDATDCLTPDTWHYIEIEWKLTTGGNGGYAKVYVDGNEVINTGNTSIASFTFFNSFGWRIGCSASANQTGGTNVAFDDVYCMEIDGVEHTAPLGACRVLAMRPSADAVPNDWTPSTGSDNYALVDDTDVDETDYVDATTSGDDDHYDLTPLEGVSVVHGVRFDVACEAVDGTPNIHIGCDNGTADEDDLGTVATGSTQNFQEFHDKDPDSADWTESSVESVEATMRMTE